MTAEEFLAEMGELEDMSRELAECQAIIRRHRRHIAQRRAWLRRAEVSLEGEP